MCNKSVFLTKKFHLLIVLLYPFEHSLGGIIIDVCFISGLIHYTNIRAFTLGICFSRAILYYIVFVYKFENTCRLEGAVKLRFYFKNTTARNVALS